MKKLTQQIQEALLGGKKLKHTGVKGDEVAKYGRAFNELKKGDHVYVFKTAFDPDTEQNVYFAFYWLFVSLKEKGDQYMLELISKESFARRGASEGYYGRPEHCEIPLAKDDIYRDYTHDFEGNLLTTLGDRLVEKYHLL